jgi:transcriptional regulator with XRE-family HTH domain
VTMLPITHFLYEIAGDGPIPGGKLAYFRERTRNNIYSYIIGKFLEREKIGFTQAKLARRVGIDPARINRMLGAPGNWTIDTISDLLLGIGAEELEPNSSSLLNRPPRRPQTPGWASEEISRSSAPPKIDSSGRLGKKDRDSTGLSEKALQHENS